MPSYIGVSPSPELNVSNIANNAITTDKILDATIANADISSSAAIATTKLASNSITINGSAVALGGSTTITTATIPVITDSSQTIANDTSTTITIPGSNFVSIPIVEFIKSDTGAITRATAVAFTSSTSINATTSLAAGTYFIRIENNDGGAARSTNAIITASQAPTFSTSAGSLGTVSAGSTVSLSVSASSNSTVSITEVTSGGNVLTGTSGTPATTMSLSLATNGNITGTAPSPTSATTYTFTLRATDGESQTVDRSFSITVSVGLNNSGQFN